MYSETPDIISSLTSFRSELPTQAELETLIVRISPDLVQKAMSNVARV